MQDRCEIPGLNLGTAFVTARLECGRGGWNSACSSELLAELNRPLDAVEMINASMFYHFDNPELRYRQVCYLYQGGFLEEAYEHLSNVISQHPNTYGIMFGIIPDLENDTRIQSIITDKGGR